MATITEDYVSFETAKLLKEKGFDILCDYAYNNKAGYFEVDRSDFDEVYCFRPSLAMVMKWLREVHNLFIEIQCYGCGADEQSHFEFSFVIYEFVQYDNKSCITVGLEKKKAASQFRAYEETCETAIKYCLKNLI